MPHFSPTQVTKTSYQISNKNIIQLQMQGNRSKCDTPSCNGKIQAVCFTCNNLFCFNCSIIHAQQNNKNRHNILELEDGIRHIQKNSNELLSKVRQIRMKGQKESNVDRQEYNTKLHPQRFQQQLDEISFMKKQTLKVVEKFYSEISLELVNMWEYYLKKYSSLDQNLDQLGELEKNIKKYTNRHSFSNSTYDEIVRDYITEEYEKEVNFLKEKFITRANQIKSIPQCPSIKIDDRILVQLSEVLCNAISTVNYTRSNDTSKRGISITQPTYLHNEVKEVPIFPIKKTHCYLFDLKNKSYEIQQFNNLDYLPDYPKTIIIPNGDIHIVGGIKKKQQILNSHLVFRSSSSEIFKLSELPYPVNPSNSLAYHNKHIYLIGGIIQKSEWTRRCVRYSLESKQWYDIASMHTIKPHQSTVVFNDSIYCFGIPESKKINIEKYDIQKNAWEEIVIGNFLSNPFNFASGFITTQINSTDILFIGGKKFLENMANNKRSTDRELSPNLYLFRPETNSFVQLGRMNPCLGVQYGEFTPVIFGGSVFLPQFLLSKNNPIARWYDNLHVLQLSGDGILESVAILNEE